MLYPKTIKNRVRRLARLRHEKSNIKIRRNAIRCQEKKFQNKIKNEGKTLDPYLRGKMTRKTSRISSLTIKTKERERLETKRFSEMCVGE